MTSGRHAAHALSRRLSRLVAKLPTGTRAVQWAVLIAVLLPALAAGYLSTAPVSDRTWFWQNQVPQGNDLRAMSWVSTSTAWAVGVSGTAMKTTDGGLTWNVQDTGSTSDLTGVSFAPTSTTGWVVGLAGTIRKTSDGGTTWAPQTAPAVSNLRAVSSWSTTVAVAVGDAGGATSTICYTANGGTTWRAANTTATAGLSSVEMVSATVGWAVGGSGALLKTTDGGATWISQVTTATAGLQSIAFAPGGTVGYFVGNANLPNWTIFKTANSGATWTPVNGIGVSGAVNLFGVDCFDANNAITVGANGAIRRTSNGGTTWTNESQNSIWSTALRAVKLLTTTSAYTIGDVGTMFYKRSGGTSYPSWFQLRNGTVAQLNAVDMVDANNGWAVGANGSIMRTTNAGQTWEIQAAGVNSWLAVASVSATQAWAVGQNGWIARTVNGSDWTTQTSPTTQQLNGVWFTTALNGVAVGNGGVALQTTNGGTSWTARTANQGTKNLNAVWFAANGTLGYLVGDGGAISGTTNSGGTWTARAFANTTQTLYAVAGDSANNNTLNQSHLWVGGLGTLRYTSTGGQLATGWTDLTASAGTGTNSIRSVSAIGTSTVWITADYGQTRKTLNGTIASPVWTTQNAGVPTSVVDPLTHMWAASFFNANSGLIVGDSGLVRRTTDGGATWTSAQYGTLASLNDVTFVDATTGFAVGGSGVVLKTSDGGQTWTNQAPGTTSGFWAVAMVSPTTGWAVGDNGTVRYTTNGGMQWSGQSATTNTVNFTSVAAADASHAVLAGQGIVNYTVNGSTWTSATTPPTMPVTGLSMIGTASVWAVSTRISGNNVVWHSDDGGKTFASQATTANANLWDVYFRDANTGYAVGDSGVVLKTVNGGTTWIRKTAPTSGTLSVIRFGDANNGWAAGSGGLAISTADGGETWSLRKSGTGLNLNGIGYAGTSRAFLVGANGLLLRNENVVAPTTSISLSPASATGTNGWYAVTAPSVTITSSATGATLYYSWTSAGGPFTTYSTPFAALEGNQTLYAYSVDTSSNAGAVVSRTIASDLTSPTAPTTSGISLVSTSSATVTWTAGADAVSGVAYYEVLLDGTVSTTTTALSAQLTGLAPNTSYSVTIRSVDAAGLRSTPSTPALSLLTAQLTTVPYVTVLASNPATPNGANGWYISAPTLTLSSVPVDAQPRSTWYSWNVTGSTVTGHNPPGAPWTLYATALAPSSGVNILYFWTQDTVGVRAPEFIQSQSYMLDTVTPDTPTVFGAATDYQSITASWTPVSVGPSGIDHYDVYLNGSLNSSVTTSAVDITGLTQQTTYTINVRAFASSGATSALSATATVTTPAPPLPFAPLAVGVKSPNGATNYVNWTASDSANGAVTYHVWRYPTAAFPTTYSIIATVTGGVRTCTFIDSGLRSSTQYYYAISTIDPRGESPLSVATSYTAATTARPQRPTNLVATGVTTTTVFLQWSPSADPALAGYAVLRADSSLATTWTTLTSMTVTTGWFDYNVKENTPYYYSVQAVDASGAISFPSVEVVGKSTLTHANGTLSPHEAVPNANGCLCHASHTASGDDKLTRFPGSSSLTLCAGVCHEPDFSSQQFLDPLAKSKHPEGAAPTVNEPFTCITCHVPLYAAGTPMANLMRVNSNTPCNVVTDTPAGNTFCYKCHGPGSTLPQGDLTYFESAGHRSIPAPPTGANITCDACHESHSSRNDYLLKYQGYEICLQCHTKSATNPNEIDIYDLLTANDGTNTAHPLRTQDQVTGARMTCQNCHNSHATSAAYPLVDPHNPSPTGTWTGSLTDIIGFCDRCHDGQPLPTSQETTPWAPPVLARGGVTTAYNMQSYYAANVHGFSSASGASTTTAYLRTDMGYKYGDVLQCTVCHEAMGSVNSNGIKGDISSASGDKTISGVATIRVNSGGRDLRFFCGTCHVWNSATHDSIAGTDTTGFPMNCTKCHTHAYGAANPGTF